VPYYTRSIQAICTALEIEPKELLPGRLAHWWQAWEAHPQYEAFYQSDQSGFAPVFDILKPQVMGVWRHQSGRGGHTESYVIGTPADVLSSLRWGNRTYGGRFIGFQPILPEALPSKYRIATWSFSYKGAGGASIARMRLKALLPREVRPWIHKARSANSRPKYHLYPFKVDSQRPREVPEEFSHYRTRTKGEIWVEEVLPDYIKLIIGRYMSLVDFWRCATGRVHPDEVEPLIRAHVRQFWVSGDVPIPRPNSRLPEKIPQWRPKLAGWLDLF
jgi:hypothetical protein